jgi:putative redox protein
MKVTVRQTKGAQFAAVDEAGHEVIVDLLKENDGFEDGQRPIELLASSLGACIGSTIRAFCLRHEIPFEGLQINVDFQRADAKPAYITRFDVEMIFPDAIPEKFRSALIRAAEQCTVHATFSHRPEIVMEIKG